MENHPIPQDVTGFQFKLIGDMTIKQFAYLAGGVITGWIFFSLPLPLILKIPIVAIFVFLGISLAFLPLAGRPMDVMFINFLKALFNPTQFVYQKTDSSLLFPEPTFNFKFKIKKENQKIAQQSQGKNISPKVFLQSLPKTPKNKLDEKETSFFSSLFKKTDNIKTFAEDKPSSPHIISINSEEEPKLNQKPADLLQTNETLSKKALLIERELENAKKQEVLQKQPAVASIPNQPHQTVLNLEVQLQEVLREKERLTQELFLLQQKLGVKTQDTYTPTTATLKKETKNVRRIPQGLGKSLGLPITPDVPNLVTGVVKNPRGQPLPNILVEVKDNEGNAVRAFKTNGVGQFASATPLINGVYTITFEDATSQNKFDAIEFTVNGTVILPLEVVSIDAREELRKSLFNQSN